MVTSQVNAGSLRRKSPCNQGNIRTRDPVHNDLCQHDNVIIHPANWQLMIVLELQSSWEPKPRNNTRSNDITKMVEKAEYST